MERSEEEITDRPEDPQPIVGDARPPPDSYRWMQYLLPEEFRRQKKLADLVLPGSHDSGAYRFTKYDLDKYATSLVQKVKAAAEWMERTPGLARLGRIIDEMRVETIVNFGITQTGDQPEIVDIYRQLNQSGIRWLDLRVMVCDDTDFYLYHGFIADKVSTVLAQIAKFSTAQPKEIIVLSFSHMDGGVGGLTPADHVRLANMIQETLGATAICLADDVSNKTVFELQNAGKKFVVFYDSAGAPRTSYQWLLAPQLFYYSPQGMEANRVESLVFQYSRAIAAYAGPLPIRVGFTTTPSEDDIKWAIVGIFNPFSKAHRNLRAFTRSSRATLPGWMDAIPPDKKIGTVSSDFVEEVEILDICLKRMGISVPTMPLGVLATVGAPIVWPVIMPETRNPSLYLLGTDGHLWLNRYAGDRWEDLDRPRFGASVLTGKGAAITVAQRAYAYVVGNGRLFLKGDGFEWRDLGSPTADVGIDFLVGATTVDPYYSPRAHAFVKGGDGRLWQNMGALGREDFEWKDLGLLPAEIDLPVGATTAAFAARREGFPYVYMRGANGNLWMWDGLISEWANLGSPSAPVALTQAVGAYTFDDTPCAFTLETDMHLWYNYADGGGGGVWEDLGIPSGGTQGPKPVGVTHADGRPYVYVVGCNGSLCVKYRGGDSQWQPWLELAPPEGVQILHGLGATSLQYGRILDWAPQAYVLGSNRQVWLNRWEGEDDGFRWVRLGI